MVPVLMSNQDAGQILRRPANGGQTLANLAEAQSRIDEDSRLAGLDVSAVA
jgi:hypothetical protein